MLHTWKTDKPNSDNDSCRSPLTNPRVRCSARIWSLQAPDGTNQPELIKAQVLIYIQQVFLFKLTRHLVRASTVFYDLNSVHGDGFLKS